MVMVGSMKLATLMAVLVCIASLPHQTKAQLATVAQYGPLGAYALCIQTRLSDESPSIRLTRPPPYLLPCIAANSRCQDAQHLLDEHNIRRKLHG